jgi:hypothetical protein
MISSVAILAAWLVPLFPAPVYGQIAGKCTGACNFTSSSYLSLKNRVSYQINDKRLTLPGQTCYIASLGASTTEPYKMRNGRKPTGGNASGDRCIKNHYKQLGLSAPAGLRLAEILGEMDNLMEYYNASGPNAPREADHAIAAESERLEKRQGGGCAANTLMFGRGTTEPGVMGSTVGPALQRGLTGAGWKVQGIQYSADLGGIYCLGMTGGLKCRDQVNALGKRCPNTKIVLSGYSQGAMVARICAAWADESVKKQIKVRSVLRLRWSGLIVLGACALRGPV